LSGAGNGEGHETLDELAAELSNASPDVVLVNASSEPIEALLDSITASDVVSDVRVVLLADVASPGVVARALQSGISALLPSNIFPDQLAATVKAAASGLVVLWPVQVNDNVLMPSAPQPPVEDLIESLTRREREVLQMLASGLANKEIAARLAISEHTVKFHVASILGKLGAGSRTEAVSIGIRRGLVLL
jgi:NarL family two-component system response regulator YdfI